MHGKRERDFRGEKLPPEVLKERCIVEAPLFCCPVKRLKTEITVQCYLVKFVFEKRLHAGYMRVFTLKKFIEL